MVKHSTYADYEIEVTDDGRWKTTISGESIYFDSLDKVHSKIDSLGKIKRKSRKLALDVVDPTLTKHRITGLNLVTYRFLGVVDAGRYSSAPDLFPDLPAIVERLEHKLQLQKELHALDEELAEFKLHNPFGRYSTEVHNDEESYEKALQRIEEIYKKAVDAAKKKYDK